MDQRLIYTFPSDTKTALAQVGGKGLSLIEAARASLPVPPGFILSVSFFEPWLAELRTTEAWKVFRTADDEGLSAACESLKKTAGALEFTREQEKSLNDMLQTYSADIIFAVRSSSPHEDLEGASFAGGYETVLGVTTNKLHDAVRRCFSSCFDHRVIAYMRETGFDARNPKIAVAVQEQIRSEKSGVGFSLNPLTNNFDEAVINANWGLGETVVSGTVTPDTFIVDKIGGRVVETRLGDKEFSLWLKESGGTEGKRGYRSNEATLTAAELASLVQLVKKVEEQYGKPIDIEWAYAGGQLYLLQARPITSFVPLSQEMLTEPGQKKRLYFDVTATAQGMTKPVSKMGTSLFRRLIGVAGRILWGRDLSRDIDTTIPWVSDGKLYFNISNGFALSKTSVLGFLAMIDPLAASAMERLNADTYRSSTSKFSLLPLVMFWKLPRILILIYRARRNPEKTHAWVQQKVSAFEAKAKRLAEGDLPLVELWERLLYTVFYDVVLRTVPLTIESRRALGRIKRAVGEEAGNKLDVALPHNVTTEMGLSLVDVASLVPDIDGEELRWGLEEKTLPPACLDAWRHFLDTYGHRGASEIDVAAPRYRDDPRLLIDLLLVTKRSPENPRKTFERNQKTRRERFQSLYRGLKEKDGPAAKFGRDYDFFETFGGYRETHKHYLVFIVGILRTKILSSAQALVQAGRLDSLDQVFDLTVDQLDKSRNDTSMDLRKLAQENTAFIRRLARVQRPPSVIDSRGYIPPPPRSAARSGEYEGVGVSGGVVKGRVKVLHSPDEKPLLKGEILVARATDPGWTPLFVNAGGIVLEIGGILQHGALVAREYGLPGVAGIEHATTLLKDGMLVEVDGTAGVVRLVKE
jgi:phosphohistidine swiveling domain-containing protein